MISNIREETTSPVVFILTFQYRFWIMCCGCWMHSHFRYQRSSFPYEGARNNKIKQTTAIFWSCEVWFEKTWPTFEVILVVWGRRERVNTLHDTVSSSRSRYATFDPGSPANCYGGSFAWGRNDLMTLTMRVIGLLSISGLVNPEARYISRIGQVHLRWPVLNLIRLCLHPKQGSQGLFTYSYLLIDNCDNRNLATFREKSLQDYILRYL